MPPKRRHDSESSSGAAAVKRIRIVAKNEQFICTDCGASLESVKQLNSHMRRHKTFLCDKCNKSISLNNKQRHQKLCGNRNQEVTMHSCAECDYKTKHKFNRQRCRSGLFSETKVSLRDLLVKIGLFLVSFYSESLPYSFKI